MALLSACGTRDKTPKLLNFKNTQSGPNEFLILPTKPLAAPEDYAALPPPTPGGANITDQNPDSDAILALGGNPAVLNRGPDGGVLGYATRFGIARDIRSDLAERDVEYRKRNNGRLLERLFSVNVYYRAYEEQSLDQFRETERFRAAGIKTSSSPPDVLQ
jgi:hypothetical protein